MIRFVVDAASSFFSKIFHKRSIIIISARRTKHVSVSGALQFCGLLLVITCVSWASYSTGSYMAARTVLEQRDETIKSVASSRIDTNFNYMVGNTQPQKFGPVTSAYTMSLTDPAYTLAAVNHDKLFARIALLENKVKELRSANAEIIQTVKERTQDKILDMEDIIRSTGLSPDALKQDAARQHKARSQQAAAAAPVTTNDAAATDDSDDFSPQGGPFIPVETNDNNSTQIFGKELNYKLDQLTLLNEIISVLPLSVPVKDAQLHSNFGRRIDPFTGRLAVHAGVDLSGPAGAKILATNAGRVVAAGWSGAYGNAVDIDHGLGITTRYGHMSAINVTEGDFVKKGQIIGVQGSTGRSTGPHVHYEVRYNDKPINPTNFLNAGYNVSQVEPQ